MSEDLRAASQWAEFLYGVSFEQLDSRVPQRFSNQPTLAHVLRSDWRTARDAAERWLRVFVKPFNKRVRLVELDDADVPAFLAFLDDQELWAWSLALKDLLDRGPSDAGLVRRFLHLRSLALLLEPLLAQLAEVHGSAEDKQKLASGSLHNTMQVFLVGRSDWRSDLWGRVANSWGLTKTKDGASLLDQLRKIRTTSFDQSLDGIAKILLTVGAWRNFASHRFSSDPALLSECWPQLLHAAVLSPLFYWKVATTFG